LLRYLCRKKYLTYFMYIPSSIVTYRKLKRHDFVDKFVTRTQSLPFEMEEAILFSSHSQSHIDKFKFKCHLNQNHNSNSNSKPKLLLESLATTIWNTLRKPVVTAILLMFLFIYYNNFTAAGKTTVLKLQVI